MVCCGHRVRAGNGSAPINTGNVDAVTPTVRIGRGEDELSVRLDQGRDGVSSGLDHDFRRGES